MPLGIIKCIAIQEDLMHIREYMLSLAPLQIFLIIYTMSFVGGYLI